MNLKEIRERHNKLTAQMLEAAKNCKEKGQKLLDFLRPWVSKVLELGNNLCTHKLYIEIILPRPSPKMGDALEGFR